MGEMMLLERLEEALVAPPPVEPPSEKGLTNAEVLAKAHEAIRNSEKWLHDVTQKIARARKHKDHRTNFVAIWPQLEPSWTRAIEAREKLVRQMDAMIAELESSDDADGAELRKILQDVNVHIVREHRFLVKTYYMLKADADNASTETQGRGRPLSSTEDLRAYFKRIRAA
jgi:CRISPR/Cas system CSM-associated protein Csm2 small subunit